jgi:[protein-PII] uridylyltransferase
LEGSNRIVQDFLESRESLIQKDLKQDSGFPTTRRYTHLIDHFIQSHFDLALPGRRAGDVLENRLALVALGGYGRQELCLGSDVDLLVIHRGGLSTEMRRLISRILYPLWDAKLGVGHTVLTVQECLRLIRDDFKTLTSVMDGRFLRGSLSFYRQFRKAFWLRVEEDKKALLDQFLIIQKKREEKYSSPGCFAEPDIKEGLGGIRDLHLMAWMARIYFRTGRFSQIRRFEAFSHFDIQRLNHSRSFLLKVRNHLHHLTGRKEDRLLLSYQMAISHSLGYKDGTHISAGERFMRRLYLHMNRVRYGSEEFHAKAQDLIDPRPFEPSPERLPPEFRVMKGNIVLDGEDLLRTSPLTILRALKEANQRGLFLGSGFIWKARKRIAEQGKALAALPGAGDLFLDLIIRPPHNHKILRLALEMGLISLFIPEFKRVRNLALFGYYHEETVDLHSLKTLEVIHEIPKGSYDERWPLFREVFDELEHPEWLFLAGLLHDIGKGYRGDHSKKGCEVVPRILERLGMTGDVLEVIPFLVKNHILLVRTSQGRDLNDEKTAVQVAQTVQSVERLRLLFLLTIGDTISTGILAHSDWTIMLLIELFLKVRHILELGSLATPDATRRLEDGKKWLYRRLRPDFLKKNILELMDQTSARYFLSTTREDMLRHFRLALTMNRESLAWVLQKLEDAPVTRVILRTHDKPGLFSKMVGVFTLNNIEVLSANIFTLKNGLAFDTYEVTNPLDPYREEEMWSKIRREAMEAIEDRLPLDEMIEKKDRMVFPQSQTFNRRARKVDVDNRNSDFFTIIEVTAPDRFELLYDLAKEIFSLGLNIRFARVIRDKVTMRGVFYVRDSNGQKVYEAPQVQGIKREILSVTA